MFSPSQKQGLNQINKIKKLSKKKGTPLVGVKFSKKSVLFEYRTSLGVKGFSYHSRPVGIREEIKRLGG